MQEEFKKRVSNVVFMGMGEPLLNLQSVVASYHLLNQELGIGGRFITVSTVGAPNAIPRLARANLKSTLAVSIHAPNQVRWGASDMPLIRAECPPCCWRGGCWGVFESPSGACCQSSHSAHAWAPKRPSVTMQALRESIIPSAKAYPIHALMEVCVCVFMPVCAVHVCSCPHVRMSECDSERVSV